MTTENDTAPDEEPRETETPGESAGTIDDGSHPQLLVFFDGDPSIDHDKLAQWVNATDPHEAETCEIETVADKSVEETEAMAASLDVDGDSLHLQGAAATLGDFSVAILYHNVPSPDRSCIDAFTMLPEEKREELAAHKGFALLSLFGGKEYHPVERLILLLKLGAGMCEQGALGIGIIESMMSFPADLVLDFVERTERLDDDTNELMADIVAEAMAEGGEPPTPEELEEIIKQRRAEMENESEGGESEGDGSGSSAHMTLWQVMRTEWEPRQFMQHFIVSEIDGRLWCFTRGHGTFGFPDLAHEVENESEIKKMHKFFGMILDYMMDNGPILAPGHTMGYDHRAAIRFHAPTENEPHLQTPNGALIVKIEKPQGLFGKIKGLFGG